MTIRFFSDYGSTSVELLQRFKANYIITDDCLQFTSGDEYDFAVVFNKTYDQIKPGAKIITIVQEPSWNRVHLPTVFLEYSDYVIIHDKELFEKTLHIKLNGQILEAPSYMFFHDPIDYTFFTNQSPAKKEKKISIIVSDLNRPEGIYEKRTNFLHQILASDLEIDIFGRGLSINDRRFKGPLDYKYKGLVPYEYSIAIENSREKNYVTEKFIDCVLCNTIPIYYGAPNIGEIYDQRYLKQIDLENPAVIDEIKKITQQKAPQNNVNKGIYFNNYNLYTELKSITLGIKHPF